MDVWDEVLPGMRKYILGVDKDLIEIWLNWERDEAPMGGATLEAPGGEGGE